MIKIIKLITVSISSSLLFKNISRLDYNKIFETLNSIILSSPLRVIHKFFFDLTYNRLTEDNLLNRATLPFGLDWRIFCDTNSKRFGLLGFVFTLVVYRWLILFKRVILWPFKLGVFSFIYSIIGFDMTWFLNIFNLFSINIPSWVYIQYLTLYSNWIDWWYNTVNIKSLNSFSTNNSENENYEASSSHLSRNIRKYISGLIALSFFALIYFLFYDGLFPSTGGSGGAASSASVSTTSASNITETVSNVASTSNSSAATELVELTNRQTRSIPPVNDAVAEMNRRMSTSFWGRPLNPPHYGANTRVTSWPNTGLTRLNVLDQLNPRNRSGSPTGSTDSSETITPSRLSRVLDSVSDRAGENDYQD